MAFLNAICARRWRARLLGISAFMLGLMPAMGQELGMSNSEREIKVAFIYNFLLFTEWPSAVGSTLTLCIFEPDPFGNTIDALQGKAVGKRTLAVQVRSRNSLKGCQAVFMTDASRGNGALEYALNELRGKPVLTIADQPGVTRQGVALNLAVRGNKISFEANLQAARAAGLELSSKLLRLATEVIQ